MAGVSPGGKLFNNDVLASIAPSSNRAATRLLCCLGISLVFHAGLYTLKPGEQLGLNVPDSVKSPGGLQATLLSQQARIEASSAPPSGTPVTEAGAPLEPIHSTAKQQKTNEPQPTANGLFIGPWYYAAQYLHRRPSPLAPIRPEYPALSDGEMHVIRILLMINASGTVDSYRIVAGESGTPFSIAVVHAFSNASYAPGLIAKMPVKSQLLAEVVFNPGNGETQTSLSSPQGENLLR
jgi:hypothetical protein